MAARRHLAVGALTAASLQAFPVLAQGPVKAFHRGRLADRFSAQPVADLVIIEGDRIARAGPDIAVRAGTCVIDLSAYTVLPGPIDAHTHVCFAPRDGKDPVAPQVDPVPGARGSRGDEGEPVGRIHDLTRHRLGDPLADVKLVQDVRLVTQTGKAVKASAAGVNARQASARAGR